MGKPQGLWLIHGMAVDLPVGENSDFEAEDSVEILAVVGEPWLQPRVFG